LRLLVVSAGTGVRGIARRYLHGFACHQPLSLRYRRPVPLSRGGFCLTCSTAPGVRPGRRVTLASPKLRFHLSRQMKVTKAKALSILLYCFGYKGSADEAPCHIEKPHTC
jgi:hypothetical protein